MVKSVNLSFKGKEEKEVDNYLEENGGKLATIIRFLLLQHIRKAKK